jgi:hypothetical protein
VRARAAIAFVLGVVLHAALIWAGLPYSVREREAPGLLWLGLGALLATVALRIRAPRTKPAAWIVGGVFAAHAALIAYDWTIDPTDHNLLPFEFVALGIVCAPAFLGQWIVARFDPKSAVPPPLS